MPETVNHHGGCAKPKLKTVNYLAHLLLADPTPASRIGNLAPDFARQRDLRGLPPDVQSGIDRHRRVDRLTDCHPAFARSRNRLFPRHGRFSGIIVDLFYDHALTRRWEQHHAAPLPEFIERCYAHLRDHDADMPEPMRPPVRRMIDQDWLGDYATDAGLQRILTMMSVRLTHRFKRPVDLTPAVETLGTHRSGILDDFDELFPAVRAAVQARA